MNKLYCDDVAVKIITGVLVVILAAMWRCLNGIA